MTTEIRALGVDEADLLDRVAADVFDDPVVPARAREFLADVHHHLVVAVGGGRRAQDDGVREDRRQQHHGRRALGLAAVGPEALDDERGGAAHRVEGRGHGEARLDGPDVVVVEDLDDVQKVAANCDIEDAQ